MVVRCAGWWQNGGVAGGDVGMMGSSGGVLIECGVI